MAKTEELKKLNILDVAQQLGMSFKRVGHGSYAWEEHDSFIISTSKNFYSWFSKDKHGDVIDLVRTVKEYQTGQPVSFKEAKRYLETGEFEQANIIEQPRPTFSYYLGQYETQDMTKARDYLRQERGLSDETIDHFIDQGLLAQATKKTGPVYEPVIVFKTLDKAGEVTGASLQGIVENRELHERGRLKQLMRASDGLSGMTLDIGQPKRLVFAESPIDLMSYYQLKKDQLSDVRLVAMDGLKEGTVSRHFVELRAEMAGVSYKIDPKLTPSLLAKTAQMTDDFRNGHFQDTITLAVDNDEAGRQFVAKLQNKGIPVTPDLPPIKPGEDKADWNDYLKQKGQAMEQEKKLTGQPFEDKDYLSQVNELIAEITKDDTSYYLWHDGELGRLEAGNDVVKEFHANLEDVRYRIGDAELYVEESINDGATGYLSLEGHVLDADGIHDYLSDQEWSETEQVKFLTQLQTDLPGIWANVLEHYDTELEGIIEKHDLVVNQKEKSLERTQEINNTGGELFNRNSSFLGEDSPGTAPQPVEHIAQPNFPTNVQLHFTTDSGDMSNKAFRKNMRTLNLYANTMRDSAQWYLSKVADTTINYIYKTPLEERLQVLSVRFDKKNWMHLTGVKPVYENRVASLSEQFIDDIANSKGHFKNLKFASGTADKLKVLNLLPEIIESDTFVFNDLSSVEKLNNLDLSQALNPEDRDLLLLFKEEGLHQVPASLMRIKGELKEKLASIDTGTVLGVYQEIGGDIKQLSINEDYIKDGGAEMMAIMQNNLFEKETPEQAVMKEELGTGGGQLDQSDELDVGKMTSLMDTIRELGRNQVQAPEGVSIEQELVHIDQLLAKFEGDADLVMTDLMLNDLIDKDSDGYRDWVEDKVFEAHGVGWADVANGKLSQDEFSDLARQTLNDLVQKRASTLIKKQLTNTPQSTQDPKKEALSEPQKVAELIANNDTKGLAEHMKAGIKTYLNSDQYKDFLAAMAKLPNYSINNVMLLKAQKQDVSAVASFNVWKKQFGRSVNKGAKALRIWAPMTFQRKDAETGQPVLDENGKPLTYTSFKLTPVFDVSQTNGREFPRPINELEGTRENYNQLYLATKSLANQMKVDVSFSPETYGARGYYNSETSQIVLKPGMSGDQTLKTFFHELAHAYLHNKERMSENPLTRSQKELQAESLAYVMCSHYGLDTSSYSFGYLANWSQDKQGLSDLEAQLQVVQKSAQDLLNRLDNILEMQQDKTKPQNKFEERLTQERTKEPTKEAGKEVNSEAKKLLPEEEKGRE